MQKKVDERFNDYKSLSNITICRSENDSAPTLEPQIVECNDLRVLNKIFGTSHRDKDSLTDYMKNNKTECALKIFQTNEDITFPQYVDEAIG